MFFYHLHNGPELQGREVKMRRAPTPTWEYLAWKDLGLGPWFLGYEILRDEGGY